MYGDTQVVERFARRDADGWGDPLNEDEEADLNRGMIAGISCEWCQEHRSPGHFVVAGRERYAVCSLCWGRAPEYLDLRREGAGHAESVARLCGVGDDRRAELSATS